MSAPRADEHRKLLAATSRAQQRMREGLGPPPPVPAFPPVLRTTFDDRSRDAIVACSRCDSTALKLIHTFNDEDGQVGQLILCEGCGRPFGLIVVHDEDEQGEQFITIAIRPVGDGSALPESREP